MKVPEEHREWEEHSSLVKILKDKEVGEFARITCPKCGKVFESKKTSWVLNQYTNHRSVHNGKN